MRAMIIRDDIEVSPSVVLSEEEKAQTVERVVMRNGVKQAVRFFRQGATLERDDCYKLVRMGIAEPVDDECRQAAAMNGEQLRQAQHAARRLSAGIHPEDFALYDAGIITGYTPDGQYQPGLNWDQMPKDSDEDDE